ncbi:MAG: TRAP transporter large permease subunit [Halofilum sp. (in: g-proteobacteria)]|nr:TRAP transporter large permease subunit [Halofilum sp. (in: g-proteobacteria)]
MASSGGQIMPPLMGAGAFVMVELTGVPYTGIMAAAAAARDLYFCHRLVRHQRLYRPLRPARHGRRGPDRPRARMWSITSAVLR